MDISLNDGSGIKIKGKNSQVLLGSLSGPATIGEFVLPGPGEYEVSGISADVIFLPVPLFHFVVDNINVAILGAIDRKLTNEEIERLGDVDVLVIDPATSSDVVSQLGASVIIPIGKNEKFLKDFGAESVVPVGKFSVSKDRLPETTTVVLIA